MLLNLVKLLSPVLVKNRYQEIAVKLLITDFVLVFEETEENKDFTILFTLVIIYPLLRERKESGKEKFCDVCNHECMLSHVWISGFVSLLLWHFLFKTLSVQNRSIGLYTGVYRFKT